MKVIILTLFLVGGLFFNASHIPAWFLGAGKPNHEHWKMYGVIGVLILLLVLILANTYL